MLFQLWTIYKQWKKIKRAITRQMGSSTHKVLVISDRVDQLIADYARSRRDAQTLASVRARMKAITEDLVILVLQAPRSPSASEDRVEAGITSDMACLELQRVCLEQLQERLPQDEPSSWPSLRSRLDAARKGLRRASVVHSSAAVSLQEDLDAQTSHPSMLQSIRDNPLPNEDVNPIWTLEEGHEKSLKSKAHLKERLGVLRRRAEAFDRAAEKLSKLIEAGDLTHGTATHVARFRTNAECS